MARLTQAPNSASTTIMMRSNEPRKAHSQSANATGGNTATAEPTARVIVQLDGAGPRMYSHDELARLRTLVNSTEKGDIEQGLQLLRDLWKRGCSSEDSTKSALLSSLDSKFVSAIENRIEETVVSKSTSRDVASSWKSIHERSGKWAQVTKLGTWALFGEACQSTFIDALRKFVQATAAVDDDVDSATDCSEEEEEEEEGSSKALTCHDIMTLLYEQQAARRNSSTRAKYRGIKRGKEWTRQDAQLACIQGATRKQPQPKLKSAPHIPQGNGKGKRVACSPSPSSFQYRKRNNKSDSRTSCSSVDIEGGRGNVGARGRSVSDVSSQRESVPGAEWSFLDGSQDDDLLSNRSYNNEVGDDNFIVEPSPYASSTPNTPRRRLQPQPSSGSRGSPDASDASDAPVLDTFPSPSSTKPRKNTLENTDASTCDITLIYIEQSQAKDTTAEEMVPKRPWSADEMETAFSKRAKTLSASDTTLGPQSQQACVAADCLRLGQTCLDTLLYRSGEAHDGDTDVAHATSPDSGVVIALMYTTTPDVASPRWLLCTLPNGSHRSVIYCDPDVPEAVHEAVYTRFAQLPAVQARLSSDEAASVHPTILLFPNPVLHGETPSFYSAFVCAFATGALALAGKTIPRTLDVGIWYCAMMSCSAPKDDPPVDIAVPTFTGHLTQPVSVDSASRDFISAHRHLVQACFDPIKRSLQAYEAYMVQLELLEEVQQWSEAFNPVDDSLAAINTAQETEEEKSYLEQQINDLTTKQQTAWRQKKIVEYQRRLDNLDAASDTAECARKEIITSRLERLSSFCFLARQKVGALQQTKAQKLSTLTDQLIASIRECGLGKD